MIKIIISLMSWLVTGILLLFTARRLLFILFALIPEPAPVAAPAESDQTSELAQVLLLVPVRNEADSLPGLLPALDTLVWPEDKYTVVFINDGSTDSSEELLTPWVMAKANWYLYALPQSVGKAGALNEALRNFPQGDIVVIYDADERPQPMALHYLIQPFVDSRVGGVSGRRAVSNSLLTPAASYAAFEGLVHQLITMRAKDRLNLAPALLGANCAYRRTALAGLENFAAGALLEDSDLTLKLNRAGWITRFEPKAISYHQVPVSVSGYWRQHTRWTRGFNDVAKSQAGSLISDRRLSLPLRLELLTFSLGYLDRLAVLSGLGLAMAKNRPVRWALTMSLLIPFFQVMAALKLGHEPAAMWRRIFWLPLFFGVDVAMALYGFWHTLLQTPQMWEERRDRV